MSKPTIGFTLHSHKTSNESERDLAQEFRRTAAAAAEAGSDTIWVWDHMLRAPVYQEPWHDPLIALAAVADFGLRLGTGVLVAPVRPAVQTAMAVATLQSLSGQPMRLGVGTGWNPKEFEAAGVPLNKRGVLTDEFLGVFDALFAGETSFQGAFYKFSDLDTGHLGAAPEIWIGGGSRKMGQSTDDTSDPVIPDAVARRIRKYERWLIRPSASIEDYERDMQALRSDGSRIVTSTMIVTHLVETDNPEEARRGQAGAFGALMTEKRPIEYLEQSYVLGSLPEIRQTLSDWCALGMDHVSLYLLGDSIDQIRLFKKHFSDLVSLGTS